MPISRTKVPMVGGITFPLYSYSNRDDGYRTQQQHSRWYSDEEDDWSRRRYDRDERGGRGREEYGR